MKAKLVCLSLGCLCSVATLNATVITIPDSNFQNLNAALNPPTLGVGSTSGSIGTWSAQISDVLSVGGQIASSNAATAGWPTPPAGCVNELRISIPAGVGSSSMIWEPLTAQLQPNSTYTLSVDLNQQASVDLAGSYTLALYSVSGSTNLYSIGGTNLAAILSSSSGFQNVSFTYKTGNHVPSTAIGVSFAASGAARLGGFIYMDQFQLSVNPIQVQLNSLVTPPQKKGDSPAVTLSGSGGAPGATYQIATCSNLFSPATVWVQLVTNQFDANGNFSQSFTVNSNILCKFFRTEVHAN
jgi:hypothetical protein